MRSGTFSRAAFLIVLAIGVRPAVGFTVAPAHLYLEIAAGAHEERGIVVNDLQGAVPVISAEPFTIETDGRPRRDGQNDHSGVGWIVAVPDGAGSIRIVVDVPADARGSYWSAVTIATDSNEITTRVVVPVIVTVAGTESGFAAVEAITASAGEDEVVISAVVRNGGNSVVRAPLLITLQKDDVEIGSAEIDPILLLPGATRVVKARMRLNNPEESPIVATLWMRYGSEIISKKCAVAHQMKSVTNS
jgi:hypothetical protein